MRLLLSVLLGGLLSRTAFAQQGPQAERAVLARIARQFPCPARVPAFWVAEDPTLGRGTRCSLVFAALNVRRPAGPDSVKTRTDLPGARCVVVSNDTPVRPEDRNRLEPIWRFEFRGEGLFYGVWISKRTGLAGPLITNYEGFPPGCPRSGWEPELAPSLRQKFIAEVQWGSTKIEVVAAGDSLVHVNGKGDTRTMALAPVDWLRPWLDSTVKLVAATPSIWPLVHVELVGEAVGPDGALHRRPESDSSRFTFHIYGRGPGLVLVPPTHAQLVTLLQVLATADSTTRVMSGLSR